MRGITVSLNGLQLSDLFFNFEHPARERVYAEAGEDQVDTDAMEAADMADALVFATLLGIPQSHIIEFAQDLARDFQRRL